MYIKSIDQLEKEINKVLINSETFSFPKIEMWLHLPDEDFKIEYPLYLDLERDFNSGITTNIFSEFLIGMGDYRDKVYANRSNLEITIRVDYGDKKYFYHRYKFILLNVDKKFDTSRYNRISQDDLNKMDVVSVKGQCVDPVVMLAKIMVHSGVYRNYDLETILKYVFGKNLSNTKINGNYINYRLDIKPLDNTKVYDHIVIPTNTKVLSLPHYFQDTSYGLYNGGVNTYIHIKDKSETKFDYQYDFRIYPIYNYDRFESELIDKKIIFYNSSKMQLDKTEKTFWLDNEIYKLVTANIQIDNQGTNKLIEEGDSLLVKNPNYMIDKNAYNVTTDKVTYNSLDAVGIKRLDVSNPFRTVIDTTGDDNIFKYRTRILKNNIVQATLKLNNIDDRVFIPGMLLKYIYNRGDEVVERKGVLQYVYTSYNITKKESANLIKFILQRT